MSEGNNPVESLRSIQRFEDLIAWQKARRLTARVYEVTRTGPIERDFALRDQMRRAALSVMGNVAEGFERHRLKEFHHFLCISMASAGELQSHFYVALDAGYFNQEQFQGLYDAAAEVARIIGGLRASIEKLLPA